jgi:hypothetical protein
MYIQKYSNSTIPQSQKSLINDTGIKNSLGYQMIVWWLDLQLTVQSVSITNKVVSSSPVHGEVYTIQHYVIKWFSIGRFVRSTQILLILCYIYLLYKYDVKVILCYIYLLYEYDVKVILCYIYLLYEYDVKCIVDKYSKELL